MKFKFEINIIEMYINDKMVVIIKGNSQYEDTDKIAKTMINIESGKYLYRINNEPTTMVKFNKYKTKSVEIECIVVKGIIMVTGVVNMPEFISCLKASCVNLQPNKINFIELVSNTVHKTKEKRYSRSINHGHISYGNGFAWSVCNMQGRDSHELFIAEYSNKLKHDYLNRSISCIIYDNDNTYNTFNYVKQLNYPSLTQYMAYMNKKITNEFLYESPLLNIVACNIIYSYDKNDGVVCGRITSNVEYVDKFDELKIRRANLKKKWYDELKKKYDYAEQEQVESLCEETGKPEFPNDVCFITHSPLYNCACALYLQNESKEQCIILVSPHVIDSCIDKVLFADVLKRLTGFDIVKKTIVKINKTAVDVINVMDISPVKKKILTGIAKYGALHSNNIHQVIISKDDDNQLYVGVISKLSVNMMHILLGYDVIYYKFIRKTNVRNQST